MKAVGELAKAADAKVSGKASDHDNRCRPQTLKLVHAYLCASDTTSVDGYPVQHNSTANNVMLDAINATRGGSTPKESSFLRLVVSKTGLYDDARRQKWPLDWRNMHRFTHHATAVLHRLTRILSHRKVTTASAATQEADKELSERIRISVRKAFYSGASSVKSRLEGREEGDKGRRKDVDEGSGGS